MTDRPLTPRGERTRQLLLDAAELTFGQKGYEHTSIANITGHAGVAQGTFYVYFKHKQAIFIDLVDDLNRRLRAALVAETKGKTDRLELERAGFRAFFKFASEHRGLYRIVRQAEFVDEATYRRYYRTLAEAYADGLKQSMERQQIGRFDPEVIAYSLMGIADFIGMRYVLWEQSPSLDAIVDDAFEMITRGLTSPHRLT